MRELSFDELTYVSGGGQQTSDEGPIVVGGGGEGGGGSDPGSGDTGDGTGEPGYVLSPPPNSVSAQSVLQQFFGELSFAESQHNEYVGSGYDHDAGADYAPYPEGFLDVPTHDPAANAPYWSRWDGDTDPEFLQAISAAGSHFTHGVVSVNGQADLHSAALQLIGANLAAAFVDGEYYLGTYHAGNAPDDISGEPESRIIVQGIHDGYWTFDRDTGGLSQSNLIASGLAFANFSGVPTVLSPSHPPVDMDATVKRAAIDLLKANSKFHDFNLTGVDIGAEIINALEKDRIVYTDDFPAGKAWTNNTGKIIYISSQFKDDPLGTAMVLAHEGLHQALFNIFGAHGDSIYEESLGKLVSAYVLSGIPSMSGITAEQLSKFQNDSVYFRDVNLTKAASDQGDFVKIMNDTRPWYGGLPEYPLDSIYSVIGGSFHDTRH